MTLAASLAGLIPAEVAASCAAASIAESAQEADVVVYGTVAEILQTTSNEIGVVRFHVERVFKGTIQPEIDVAIGPKSEPLSSTDYVGAKPGEKHTLYLYSADNDPWKTSLCTGSHAGAPTAEETTYFGPGREPAVAGTARDPVVVGPGREFSGTQSSAPRTDDTPVVLGAIAIAAIALAVAILTRRATQGRRH